MKIWIVIILLILVDCTSDLLLAQGMKQVGEISTLQPKKLWQIALRLVKKPIIRWSFLFQASTFLLFLILLSWADVSLVIPLTSLSSVVSVLGAQFLLKEKVTQERWLGTLLICVGVALVSINSGRK